MNSLKIVKILLIDFDRIVRQPVNRKSNEQSSKLINTISQS